MTIQKILLKYKPKRENLLDLLHEVNDQFGFISKDHSYKIAEFFNMSPAELFGVITSSEVIRSEKPKQLEIEICVGSICKLKGAGEVVAEVEKYLGIRANRGVSFKIKLETINCIGRCQAAPLMVVNGTIYERVSPSNVDDILKNYV